MKATKSIKGEPALSTNDLGKILGMPIPAHFIEDKLGIAPDLVTANGKYWLVRNLHYISHELAQYFGTFDFDYSIVEDLYGGAVL